MSTPKRFRFTNQLIKSLPPNTSDSRSTDAEYSDTEISGLKCLVSKGEGRKKFLLRYLYHGRKRAIAIGHWPEVDVTLARKIAMEHKPCGFYEKKVKRPLDFLLSSCALVVLSPVMGITAIMVHNKLGSPVLFKQNRPGKDENSFKIYKFFIAI